MFRFGSSAILWSLGLVPALALLHLYAGRRRRALLDRFGDRGLVEALLGSVNAVARRWKAGLSLAAFAALILALARPQFGSGVEIARRQGRDVVVALDVSRSMYAGDLAPNRLERAKIEVGRIVQRLDGDRVGLVSFAGDAFVQSPLTTDYGAAMMFLAAMDPESMSTQGTDLARALTVSLEALEETPREHRVVVVVTDGEDHEGGLAEAVGAALAANARVHAVGAGSVEGAPLPNAPDGAPGGGFRRDERGRVITTRLNETVLRDLVLQTGGEYYRIGDGADGLERLMDSLEGGGRDIESRRVARYEERYQVFLVAGLLLLLADFMVPGRRSGRVRGRARRGS